MKERVSEQEERSTLARVVKKVSLSKEVTF